MEGTKGWWFSLNGADFDKDGDIDLVAGNLGLNMRFRASREQTFDVYAGDFDKDGKSDIALCYYQGKHQYPVRNRDGYLAQNPGLAKKFPTYESFAKAEISDIYPGNILDTSLHLQAENGSVPSQNTIRMRGVRTVSPGCSLKCINCPLKLNYHQ